MNTQVLTASLSDRKDNANRLYADTMWVDVNSPTSGVVRAYGDVKGNEFFVFPIGILNSVTMEPRRNMDFDVIDPMTGAVVDHLTLNAGDRFTLRGAATFVLKGTFR